ncbi:MAG: hypothetical protein IH965_12395 [Gemmatimonadetes bacterium]|nr:hypothetical protein [Gemmatimonadota bacterium]
MTVRLTTDKTTYESGETIELELVLENGGSEPITLEFTTSQRYDFEIRNAEDELLWRWSDEMGFAQMLGSEIVEPGGRLRYEEEFSMALDAGTYRVIGYIAARDVDLRDELEITVQ